MRTPLALLLAAVLGALTVALVSLANAQAPPPARGWPPHPKNIVNLTGQTPVLQAGTSYPLFTVPQDRWLVLTNIRFSNLMTSDVELVEDLSGVKTPKVHIGFLTGGFGGPPPDGSGVGFTFAPGSTVELNCINPNSQGLWGRFVMVGYYAQP